MERTNGKGSNPPSTKMGGGGRNDSKRGSQQPGKKSNKPRTTENRLNHERINTGRVRTGGDGKGKGIGGGKKGY